jgi:hypothetical protein
MGKRLRMECCVFNTSNLIAKAAKKRRQFALLYGREQHGKVKRKRWKEEFVDDQTQFLGEISELKQKI